MLSPYFRRPHRSLYPCGVEGFTGGGDEPRTEHWRCESRGFPLGVSCFSANEHLLHVPKSPRAVFPNPILVDEQRMLKLGGTAFITGAGSGTSRTTIQKVY